MDDIYIELLQKDSLMSQSKISRSKEFKYIELIDSTQKDVELLKTELNSLRERYNVVLISNQKQKKRIRNAKTYFLSAIGIIIIQAIIGVR